MSQNIGSTKIHTFNNHTLTLQHPAERAPEPPRGYFMLNICQADQDELRAYAKAIGQDLRTVLTFALRRLKLELKAEAELCNRTGLPIGAIRCIGYNGHRN